MQELAAIVYCVFTTYFDPVSILATDDFLSRGTLDKLPITPAKKPTPAPGYASFPGSYCFSCSSIRRENGGGGRGMTNHALGTDNKPTHFRVECIGRRSWADLGAA
jgi:hypothetical protein